MKKFLLFLFLVFTLLFTSCNRNQNGLQIVDDINQESATPITVSESQVKNIAESFYTIGRVSPNAIYVISPPSTSFVDRILVKNGDLVNKGQTLYVLDQRNLSNNLIQTESALRTVLDLLNQQLLELEAQRNRIQNLYNAGAVSKIELERLNNQIDALLLQIEDAEINYNKQIQNIQYSLSDRFVVSPGRGIVSGLDFSEGEIIGPQNTFNIIDNLDLEIHTSLTASQMRSILELENAKVRLNGDVNRSLNAHITKKDSVQNSQTGLYDLILKIDISDVQLFDGEYVEVVFTFGERLANLVPLKAVKRIGTDTYLYKEENGRAIKTSVNIGKIHEEWVEIVSELPKAKWIVEGIDSIQDQSIVKIVD